MHRQAGHDYINVTEKSFFPLEEEKKTRENNNVTFSVRYSHTHSSWHERTMKHALVLLAEGKDKFDPPGSAVSCSAWGHLTDLAEKHCGVIFGQSCSMASWLPTRAGFAICTAANK
jgi:hypothetical protein